MIDSVRIRREGALDFQSHYENLCALQDSVPVPALKDCFKQDTLSFNADCIKASDWPPILNTLKINKNLTSISIKSCHQSGLGESGAERVGVHFKRRIPPIRSKDITFRLCTSLADCLSVSNTLKNLELHGLPLRERDLKALSKGLAASSSLENVSLPYCACGDDGLEIICQSVKNSPTIKTVNFTACDLTWRGAEYMANIIKHQATRRHSETWAESLRYRRPDLDCMAGLRRVTLNCNTLLGDRGAIALAEILGEDLWLKALDLRQCGISNTGAQAFLRVSEKNTTLMVLDIRRNPLIDHSLLKMITERVLMNAHGTKCEYKWFTSPSSKDGSKVRQKWRSATLKHGRRGRNTMRIGLPTKKPLVSVRKATSKELYDPEPKPPGVKGFCPWRTAERANRCRENSDWIPDSPSKTGISLRVSMSSETSGSEEDVGSLSGFNQEQEVVKSPGKSWMKNCRRLQMELKECQLILNEERKIRLRADDRIIELEAENAQLRQINQTLSEELHARTVSTALLEDDGVLDSIEKSFNKFHAFLDLLRDAGLGELASVAGIDQSDFNLPGDHPMSSTVGRSNEPYIETPRNLHGTYVINQVSWGDGELPQLSESCASSAVSPSHLEFYTTNHKSKGVMRFDPDEMDREANTNSRPASAQQHDKDVCVKKGTQPDEKGASNRHSSSDSNRSKKSNESKKYKASPGERDKTFSSKRSHSAGTNRTGPQGSVAGDQNGTKTPTFSDASVSGSDIQENFRSTGSQRSNERI
ncbi:centrosomal protein of 78 kDa [Pelodytes ibericus]